MATANTGFVAYNEIAIPMTDEEYAAFVEKDRETSYFNHASEDSDGVSISVASYILAGIEIMSGLTAGDK